MNNLFGEKEIELISKIKEDEITQKISSCFDYEWNGETIEKIKIPVFPKDFQIGLIVGSSGSGKSTISKIAFGEEEHIEWDNEKSIASNFKSYEEAIGKLGMVGLNSIPTWLKPYKVLSNGEKFRADLARRIKDNAIIDEFTSVVNREVAIACSNSISKYIYENNIKNVVFISCHYDIIPYLNPSWVYDTDKQEFIKEFPTRDNIIIRFKRCGIELWEQFKKYHYLSGEINKSSRCYCGYWGAKPIVFIAVLPLVSNVKNSWREHRLVVLPDYQGLGIGNKTSEMIAQCYLDEGYRYFGKTSNVRIGEHRNKSNLWKATIYNQKDRNDYQKAYEKGWIKEQSLKHKNRVCYCHEFIGNGERKIRHEEQPQYIQETLF